MPRKAVRRPCMSNWNRSLRPSAKPAIPNVSTRLAAISMASAIPSSPAANVGDERRLRVAKLERPEACCGAFDKELNGGELERVGGF